MTRLDNPFKNPETIDGTRHEIAAVFAENIRKKPNAKTAVGAGALKNAVQTVTTERHSGEIELLYGLDEHLLDAAEHTKEHFNENILDYDALYNRMGFDMPAVKDFITCNTDFGKLAKHWEKLYRDGYEPQLVIAPYNAPLSSWKVLFSTLMQDKSIPDNPLRNVTTDKEKVDGFYVSEKVAENWDKLNDVPYNDTNGLLLPAVGFRRYSAVCWMVRVIEGASESKMRNMPHMEGSVEYPTIPEYLAMQAQTVHQYRGSEMLDTNSLTWLHGNFYKNSTFGYVAPVGQFTSKGLVGTSERSEHSTFEALGSRMIRSSIS